MITIRKSSERGYFDHGWLKTYHTFSFSEYFDPNFMGFRALRVINEDFISPSKGFGTHGHRDMEIITFMIQGALEHRDSMGNGSVIRPGEIQYMSAGTGVTHSEFNALEGELAHLLQIWIQPDKKGYPPTYGQQKLAIESNRFQLLASNRNEPHSILIRQDADIFFCRLDPNQEILFRVKKERHVWIQTIQGPFQLNGLTLEKGDGAAISSEDLLAFKGNGTPVEFLLFDLN